MTAHLNLKLDKEVKSKAEKAPALPEQYESMTLENDLFDRFVRICNEMKSPNQALVDAAAFARGQ